MLVIPVLIRPGTYLYTHKDPNRDTISYLYFDDMYLVVYTKQVLFRETGFVDPLW